MTQHDKLQCVHEPFGDAFYYGPERLSSRYANDAKGREESGFTQSTYKTILDRIEKEGAEVRTCPPRAFQYAQSSQSASSSPCASRYAQSSQSARFSILSRASRMTKFSFVNIWTR